MSDIHVDATARRLSYLDTDIPCLIGKNGAIAANLKREGDGATPLGCWAVRTVLLRPDRITIPASLVIPWRWLRPEDGWSDDVADPGYNRPVVHPRQYSAERLWRDDGLYDIIVTLGHNDDPPVKGLGSAIFLHCIGEDRAFTEGCVAVDRAVLLEMIRILKIGDKILIE